MEVRSNRIGDVRSHYRQKLMQRFSERESNSLLFLVLMEYTGLGKAEILTRHQDSISESQLLNIHFAVDALLRDKPVQYILGNTEFFGLPFIVNPWVLIPRPETEELVDLIIRENKSHPFSSVIDLGTGSGNIAVSLKKSIPGIQMVAADISDFALEVARSNAELNEVDVTFEKLDLLDQSTWRKNWEFDVVVSNPPYVRNLEKKSMKRNVLDYEPGLALFVPDDDPFIFYRAIIDFSKQFLKPGGGVFCEINQYLSAEIVQLFVSAGFKDGRVVNDLQGNARIFNAYT
jgi:release factor glutamine methyltransferase